MTQRIATVLFIGTIAFSALLIARVATATSHLTSIAFEEIAGLNSTPVDITHAGDDRLFLVEKAGIVRIYENGALVTTPFLNISSKTTNAGERGLLGLAFHPDYSENGEFYVHYSQSGSGDTVIARYHVSDNDVNVAAITETVVLVVEQPFGNHNSGPIRFGPDGYLYVSLGDGGSQGDPNDYAQDGDSLLGKLLRLDVTDTPTYTIPASNPFTQTASIRDEIWGIGFRNPWRFDFDAVTGDLWLADVGQTTFEEVNYVPAGMDGGLNFGWDCYEATSEYGPLDSYDPSDECNPETTYYDPVHHYPRSDGRSVTGGTVYRGSEYSAMYGHYFFADYLFGTFWTLFPNGSGWTHTRLTKIDAGSLTFPSTFGVDLAGEIYVGFDGNDRVYKITTPDTVPTAVSLTTYTASRVSIGLVVMAAALLGLAAIRVRARGN